MSATVVINLWVGALDKKGQFELGERIDRRCGRGADPATAQGVRLAAARPVLAGALCFFVGSALMLLESAWF